MRLLPVPVGYPCCLLLAVWVWGTPGGESSRDAPRSTATGSVASRATTKIPLTTTAATTTTSTRGSSSSSSKNDSAQQQERQQRQSEKVPPLPWSSVPRGGAFLPPFPRTTVAAECHHATAASNDDTANSNEWGIPLSASLPPLVQPSSSTSSTPASTVLPNGGRITLLGAGPGDPDLLTVAAHRLLTTGQMTATQSSSSSSSNEDNILVVADRLVAREILDLIPFETKVARKLPGCAELAQEEIYWWCYQALNQGKHVIRLKIGDPMVFGRGGEEVIAFRRFGVNPVIVPGVSAAVAAPLLAHIPVTHRGVANQVVLGTGYGRDGTSPELIQYHKEQTVVFLMAVGRLQELCEKLIRLAHYPPETPVAIVEKAGCFQQQRTLMGNLQTIAALAVQHKIQPPSTIVVGNVVHVLLSEEEQRMAQSKSGLMQDSTTTTTVTSSVMSSAEMMGVAVAGLVQTGTSTTTEPLLGR